MQKSAIFMVVGAVVIAGAGFLGGTMYGTSQAPAASSMMTQAGAGGYGARGGAGRSGRAGGGFSGGTILSIDDKSITIKLPDGGSKTIYFSGTTQIGKMVSGSSTDLTVGQQVMTMGSANSDGSITATSIQIRPAMSPTPSTSSN